MTHLGVHGPWDDVFREIATSEEGKIYLPAEMSEFLYFSSFKRNFSLKSLLRSRRI